MMRFPVLFLALLGGGISTACAQVEPAAYARPFSVTVGGLGSGFQPDYGPNYLFGAGAFVDVAFSRWVQVEAEGRWLRLNQYENVWQDNYLIGPRIPVRSFGRVTPYGKVLVGMGSMNFQFNYAYGRFTDIAYGGGVDLKLTNRLSLRPVDFEYQEWPKWLQGQGQLFPYGVSVGVSYRLFGRR